MPLAGTLRQHALPDILHLIERGQSTGRLVIVRGAWQALVYFGGGQWLNAERAGAGTVLAYELAHAALLTPEQFEGATGTPFAQAHLVPDRQLIRLLVGTHILSEDDLRGWAFHDAVALLTAVLAWPDGSYDFQDGVPVPAGRVAFPLPVGPLMAQATRALRGSTSSREMLALTPQAVLAFAEIDPPVSAPIQLTRQQWSLLRQVDGSTPLWGIARAVQQPEPVIVRVAGELVAAGIAVIVGRVAAAASASNPRA